MAHLIETMAYAGATPWHKLGVPVSSDLTPSEIADAASIDWQVEKRPLYIQGSDGSMIKVEDQFALTRTTDNRVFDVVGPLYKPVQNLDAIEFFSRFVSAGDMKMETAGSLDGGRRIWGLASINDGFTLAGGDRINGYLLLCSPHRQGEAFTVKLTSVRVVCNNTLTAALSGKGAAWRMSHVRDFDQSMKDAAAEALGLAKSRLQDLKAKGDLLSHSIIGDAQRLIEYVARVSGSDVLETTIEDSDAFEQLENLTAGGILEASLRATEARQVTDSDLNRLGRTILESVMDSPGADLPSARGTWWGALNGVTHAVDHLVGRSDDTRLTSAWFGQRAQMKAAALDLAVEFAQGAR
jgi:phage/plasmid-like protein (TIGR03299 family)